MPCRSSRSYPFCFAAIFFAAFLSLFSQDQGVGFLGKAFGQQFGTHDSAGTIAGHRPSLRDEMKWNLRGRTAPLGESAARLRLRAYQQKLAMRKQRAAIFSPTRNLTGPSGSGVPGWAPVGPAPLASDATGDGLQDYNWVSGRATSVVIDPADASGNTVLLGGAYGGLWKSINAGSQSSAPSSVVWQPLIDDQPTLAVGAIALQPGNSSVILVGTGETNNSGDSYYGLGILRSADGGSTWPTQIQSAASGQSFLGIGFSKIAFSTANPNIVIAATAGDNGLYVGLEEDGNSSARGLYFSQDAGVTWNRCILSDGAVPSSATAVIYNASSGTFYAFIRRHGLYSSTDGQHFTRLTTQPTAGLSSANCPASSNASSCLIYRGELAVVPGRNEMYVWVVDVQPDNNGDPLPADEGIWQSTTGGTTWTQIPDNGITNCGDNAFDIPDNGCGVEQGWYNLALAAIPDGAATDIYAGAVNLYKCTLTGGTTCNLGNDWMNLTHVYGCNPLAATAHVHPNQHAIAFTVVGGTTSPGYFAHDGGISRTLDGYSGLTTGSCAGTNQFDSLAQPQSAGNLNTLGSMTEFVSVSLHPASPDILLGGTQGNGSPKTSTTSESSTWQSALGGDGGFTAINPTNPDEWFAANPGVTISKCESGTACHECELGTNCNDGNQFVQIVSPATLGGDQGAFNTPFILDPQNSSEMLVGTCRVWQINTGANPAPLQLSNDFDTLGTGVCTGDEINLVNALAAGGPKTNGSSSVVYAVTNGYGPLSGDPGGEVWATTNAGLALMANVTQNVNPQGYSISSVAIDQSDSSGNTAYIGIMGFSTPAYPTSHVWKTSSAGQYVNQNPGWTDWSGAAPTQLPDAPVNAFLVDAQAGLIYAATDVGVFMSPTSAPSWTEVGPAPGVGASGFLPEAPVTSIQIFNPNPNTKTLVASTYGRGIWNYALVSGQGYTNAISNSPQTIFPTETVIFNGTLTAQDGYASSVNLTCTGASPAICTLQPISITPTASYTLTAGGTAGDYTFNAHAFGTDQNNITRDAQVTLHVVDFNIAAPSPNSLTVQPGGTSTPATFQVTAAGSFAGTIALSCPSGLPTGAACVFSPSNSVTPTSSNPVTVTLTVSAGTGTPVGGPATVTISAVTPGAPSAKTQTFTLTVVGTGKGFTWTDTGSTTATVLAGITASYTFSAVPGGGSFTSIVNFGCTGLPLLTNGAAGAQCTFSPSAIAAGATTTAVAVTIWTCGPNLPTLCPTAINGNARRSAVPPSVVLLNLSGPSASDRRGILPFFTLGWIVAGMLWVGRIKHRDPRLYGGIPIICLGLGLIVLISCGGVSGSGTTTTPATVTVTPGLATLFADESTAWAPGLTQQQFTATVNGSTDQTVTWSVLGNNNGTVDGTGLYTAPTLVPSQPTATVTATSTDATAPGSTFVTVAAPTVLGTSQITVTATPAGGAAQSDVVTLTVR